MSAARDHVLPAERLRRLVKGVTEPLLMLIQVSQQLVKSQVDHEAHLGVIKHQSGIANGKYKSSRQGFIAASSTILTKTCHTLEYHSLVCTVDGLSTGRRDVGSC